MGNGRCGTGTATRAGGATACGVEAPSAGFNDTPVTAGVRWPAPMGVRPRPQGRQKRRALLCAVEHQLERAMRWRSTMRRVQARCKLQAAAGTQHAAALRRSGASGLPKA